MIFLLTFHWYQGRPCCAQSHLFGLPVIFSPVTSLVRTLQGHPVTFSDGPQICVWTHSRERRIISEPWCWPKLSLFSFYLTTNINLDISFFVYTHFLDENMYK
jgi:hypothetical protein